MRIVTATSHGLGGTSRARQHRRRALDNGGMAAIGGFGEFLTTRRAGLQPADVGLPDFGGSRRVAGLRREELANLAGISVDYYTRLEQGRVANPSEAVLDAVARALLLTDDETRHLYRLARPRRTGRQHRPQQQLRPSLRRLLDTLIDVPALVMGQRMDILAFNRAACSLLGDYTALTPAQRNVARITFLDPASRDLYADWVACARENVAYLHLEAGRRPGDRALAQLVGELSMESADFRRWWAEHPVKDRTSGIKRFHHPLVGDLELFYETLRVADDSDQALITYTAEPDTSAHDALQMLLTWTASTAGDDHPASREHR